MDQAEQAMVERVINHEIQERFGAGVVRRAVLLGQDLLDGAFDVRDADRPGVLRHPVVRVV